MGIGIWSMHFVGMLAYSVDTPLLYGAIETLFSLGVAILTSGFALGVASRKQLSTGRLLFSALVMGLGISAMHYSGMAAILINPAIRYDPWLVVASVVVACGASTAALWLAFRLRTGQRRHNLILHSAAAVVMGLGISGMHYTGMAACRIALGSICYGGTAIDNNWLAIAIGMFALGVLAITLITSIYDSHRITSISEGAERLERLNHELHREKNLLSLATQAAGISYWEYDVRSRKVLWVENDISRLTEEGIDLKTYPNAIVELVHPDDRNVVLETLHRSAQAKQETCGFRCRIELPRTKQIVHLDCHARIFTDDAGQPINLIAASRDVTPQIEQEQREAALQFQLRDASREAGRAEVAAGVLHNVGNTLNSLGVSASHVGSKLRTSRIQKLPQLAEILGAPIDEPEQSSTDAEKIQLAKQYLGSLATLLVTENEELQSELTGMQKHLAHISEIISAQQSYAGRSGVVEDTDIAELLDQSITHHLSSEPTVKITRDYLLTPTLALERHKLMQIFGNLITNARHALREVSPEVRHLHVSISAARTDDLIVAVTDTGVGISAENLSQLFSFGFTTKTTGHGFGLHNSALLARELGGSLSARSDGVGHGAVFELRLPLNRSASDGLAPSA
ncbi:MHYT domain-containing protein [Synoicihabitans lomoniglobus]|uniref:histidine kinase n=2 Tax=Synoicihabitans lomoniglobus TaxID=2909285 RepID=A0AAF0CSY6_9BACT|nr:MHYT domain-containing protein [Opitutaceae bacterium LMO-M01]